MLSTFHEMIYALFSHDTPLVVKILGSKKLNINDYDYKIFRELLSTRATPDETIFILKVIISNYQLDEKAYFLAKKIFNIFIKNIHDDLHPLKRRHTSFL